jgi:hypothetical protein
MPVEIVGCCDGTGTNCRKYDCPAYREAEPLARTRKGPSMPTGYGDANSLSHGDILQIVLENKQTELQEKG